MRCEKNGRQVTTVRSSTVTTVRRSSLVALRIPVNLPQGLALEPSNLGREIVVDNAIVGCIGTSIWLSIIRLYALYINVDHTVAAKASGIRK